MESNVKETNRPKECLGSQGREMLYGEFPKDCMDCAVFDKCHKITIAASLQSISEGMDLIIQNGLSNGQLKSFQELEKEYEADEKSKH